MWALLLSTTLLLQSGEPRSAHVRLSYDADDFIEASVEVKVDALPNKGLKFFALQVNFDRAWAHGGLQHIGGKLQSNWGGLSNQFDYSFGGHELETLELIQNNETRIIPHDWKTGRWYRYTLKREPQVTLPSGLYGVTDGPKINVDHPRTLWQWRFTETDVETGQVIYDATLHTADAVIRSLIYWSETGYGVSCSDLITVHWKGLSATSLSKGLMAPKRMSKSLAQSNCDLQTTTDLAPEEPFGQRGVLQTYGIPRAPGSVDKGVLYSRPVVGKLDVATCAQAAGWVQDLDAPTQPLKVKLFVDDEATPRLEMTTVYRTDLCTAIGACEQAFTFQLGKSLDDHRQHVLKIVGEDTEGTWSPPLFARTEICGGEVEPPTREHVSNDLGPKAASCAATGVDSSLASLSLLGLGARKRQRRRTTLSGK